MRAAITCYREGGSIELASSFAWIALLLTSLRVRDDAWTRMDPTTTRRTCGCGRT